MLEPKAESAAKPREEQMREGRAPGADGGPKGRGDAEELMSSGRYSEAARAFLELSEGREDADRGPILHRAAVAFWKAGNYSGAVSAYRRAARCRRSCGDRGGEARELLGLGASYHGLGRTAEAYQVMHEALEAAEEIEDSRCLVDATNWLGIISRSQEDFALAIEHHRRALRLSRNAGDGDREASTLNSLGLARHHLGDLERALEHFGQSLEIRRELELAWGCADTLSNMGMTLKDLGRPEEALQCYTEAVEIRREIGGGSRIANVLNNMGNLLLEMGRQREAIRRHKEALRIRRRIGHRKGIASSLLNLGEAWSAVGRSDYALLCLRASLRYGRDLDVPDLRVETLSMLSKVLGEAGMPGEALEAAGEALRISRDHYAARERKKLAQARALLETEHQAREARVLRRKNRRLSRLSDMLSSKKEQLQLILDYVPAVVVFCDPEGTIARLNRYAAGLADTGPRELVGRAYGEVFGRLGLSCSGEMGEAMRSGEPVVDVERRVSGEGGDRHFLMHLVPYRGSGGDVSGAVVFAVDVSAEREAEEKREEVLAYRERSRRLESLSRLAGTIAHDFNNLLLGIMGNVELASMKMPESAAGENLAMVLESSRRAAELCRQMLAFSGKGKFVTRRLDLSGAARSIMEEEGLFARGVRLQTAEGLPVVDVDEAQLRQALGNLVEEGVRRDVGPEAMLFRTGRCRNDGKDGAGPGAYVFVELLLEGLRIAPGDAGRLMEPFPDAGAGLEMPAVAGIARAHGGSLEVRSERAGTAIRLCFPASADASAPGDSAKPQPSSAPDGAVLVVDDEAAVRQTAGEMLRSLGYSAVACPGGAEALELLDSGEPAVSCVLLDLTMPGMDGQEVLRQISIRHPRIPVVLSSGFSRSSVTGLSENPCYRGFLHKPYSSSELEQTMRSVMS